MSLDTVRRVAEVARRAREPGAADDPTFFDLKAEVFDAIALEDNPLGPTAAEAQQLAETARAHARDLRAKACGHTSVSTVDERGPAGPGNWEPEFVRVHRCASCGAEMAEAPVDGEMHYVVKASQVRS